VRVGTRVATPGGFLLGVAGNGRIATVRHRTRHSRWLFTGCAGPMGDEPLAPYVAPRGGQPGGFLSG
jgi:hypothetical protein